MTKTELIQTVWEKNDFSREAVETIINDTFQVIAGALVQNDEVSILNFGTFKLRNVVEHKARNVKTGETIIVPAKKHPAFKAGKNLKAKVNS